MANGKYDSPEDRKRRTTTRSLSALQEQKAQYRDASASPAETDSVRENFLILKWDCQEGASLCQ